MRRMPLNALLMTGPLVAFALSTLIWSRAFSAQADSSAAAEAPREASSSKRPRSMASSEAFSAVYGAREADRAVSDLRAELKAQWREHARAKGIDEELDRATTDRLKDEYFAAIDEWALASEGCEPNGVNRKWLPRLLKAFTQTEIEKQREDVARILGALAAERLSECSGPAQERALRAERELHAFVAERLRAVLEFFEQLEPGSVRASTRHRIARLEKGIRAQRPLADRSVSVGALRLKTAAAYADPSLVDHLESDPAFQRPFALKTALAQLAALNRAAAPAAGQRLSSGGALHSSAGNKDASKQGLAQAPSADVSSRPRSSEHKEEPTVARETLSTPWLLQ